MNSKTISSIHKQDVHALYIWCGDSIDLLENNISIQVHDNKTPIEIENDRVMVYPHLSNIIVNVRSNNIDFLKMYVEEMFPHLSNVGHPVVDGEVFDGWIAYVDDRGAAIINGNGDSDTVVGYPLDRLPKQQKV